MLDLLIAGGGINGAAIAREAALNGLNVLLVERDDLAGATSSASSGLIHGGLRYLEQYDFHLVREALTERERLLHLAPHLVRPLPFVMPHAHSIRPWWMVRAGLLLYDLLAFGSSLPHARGLRASDRAYLAPIPGHRRGFVYSDARVDDARLTVLNAMDAAGAGATVRTRVALVGAAREAGHWRAGLSDGTHLEARAIVNAAGPWVSSLLATLGVRSRGHARLVKGSHIVVPSLYAGDHAYTLQQPDRRIVFTIPWHGATVIGTTDIPVEKPEDARIETAEIAYLVEAANNYFETGLTPASVIASWSGVRPLFDDNAADARNVTREYVLELDREAAPILSVFGGKITTARALAEEAVEKLAGALDVPFAPATRTRHFPGGDIGDPAAFRRGAAERWPFLDPATLDRMVEAYGSLLPVMLADVHAPADMGRDLGHGLSEREVAWMIDREWARTAEDILLRRSRIGRIAEPAVFARVEAWLAARGVAEIALPQAGA